jgi:hypothetical protein
MLERDVLGQELRQGTLARIEVESCNRPAFLQMKIGKKARQQRFSNARPRRCDDSDRVTGRHQIPRCRPGIGLPATRLASGLADVLFGLW